jgi:hypothetical protein
VGPLLDANLVRRMAITLAFPNAQSSICAWGLAQAGTSSVGAAIWQFLGVGVGCVASARRRSWSKGLDAMYSFFFAVRKRLSML